MVTTRILLADDKPVIRRGVASVLDGGTHGFDIVGETCGGPGVVEKVQELKPDVVIMDILSAKGNGLDVTRAIRARFPDVNVVVFTDSDKEDDLSGALRAGASAYILKTAQPTELIESVRVAAAGESSVSRSLIDRLVNGLKKVASNDETHSSDLSQREIEILRIAARGASNKEIAAQCAISVTTVKAHFRNILGKMEATNRTGAVAKAIGEGLFAQ